MCFQDIATHLTASSTSRPVYPDSALCSWAMNLFRYSSGMLMNVPPITINSTYESDVRPRAREGRNKAHLVDIVAKTS